MKIYKPLFWDNKKKTLLSRLLKIFTYLIILKNKYKHNKIKFPQIKKICVGNIYLGGTGKTPSCILIYNLLKKNKRITFIKKFYTNQIDEQKLLKLNGNLICKKTRAESILHAIKKKYDIAIFDDGLQDKTINYDLKIVCFNSKIGVGNGELIPAGPLREKIDNLKNYHIALLNGNGEINKKLIEIIKRHNKNIKIFQTIYTQSKNQKIDKKISYIAFSGIGNHSVFLDTLSNNKIKIIKHYQFPDHYIFTTNDINEIRRQALLLNANIITTEKDYLRINPKDRRKIQYLKIKLKIKKKQAFLKCINNYEKN